MNLNKTAHKILDTAEELTQTRGFSAFSYTDIHQTLGIKTSSIHYYFKTKQDMACQMIERFMQKFMIALDTIEHEEKTAKAKLEKLSQLFLTAANEGKICLCGMLAADILLMSPNVESQLKHFFTFSESWIANCIDEGIKNKEFHQNITAKKAAAHFLAALEGGMLIARVQKKTTYLQTLIEEILSGWTHKSYRKVNRIINQE